MLISRCFSSSYELAINIRNLLDIWKPIMSVIIRKKHSHSRNNFPAVQKHPVLVTFRHEIKFMQIKNQPKAPAAIELFNRKTSTHDLSQLLPHSPNIFCMKSRQFIFNLRLYCCTTPHCLPTPIQSPDKRLSRRRSQHIFNRLTSSFHRIKRRKKRSVCVDGRQTRKI